MSKKDIIAGIKRLFEPAVNFKLTIAYKEYGSSTPEVIENHYFKYKFTMWWKRYIDTVDLEKKSYVNGTFTKTTLKPHFTVTNYKTKDKK